MQHFVNEYGYTQAILEESIGAWWDYKFKGMHRSMLIVSILILAVAALKRWPVFLLAELAPLFIILLFRYKKKKAVQSEWERIDVLYHGTDLRYRVEVDGDITFTSPKARSRIRFSDVEGYIETKDLIVLLIRGSMTLPLDKKGFKEGTKEAFMSLLADKVR